MQIIEMWWSVSKLKTLSVIVPTISHLKVYSVYHSNVFSTNQKGNVLRTEQIISGQRIENA